MIDPFILEVNMIDRFQAFIHDLLTEKEMDWMIQYSQPFSLMSRQFPLSTAKLSAPGLRYLDRKSSTLSIGKSVTAWFNDIYYNDKEEYIMVNNVTHTYDVNSLTDPNGYTLRNKIMHVVSRIIELASQFNVTTSHGATQYQITNYGLAGMLVPHMDAWGYDQGANLVKYRKELARTGNVIVSLMGCLQDTQAGGETAFTSKRVEGTVAPIKGSVEFGLISNIVM